MSKKKTLRVFAAKCFDSICVKAFVPFFRRLFRQTLFAPIRNLGTFGTVFS